MNKLSRKYTIIRKWAKEKGYELNEETDYFNAPSIDIVVNEKLRFKLEVRFSTLHYSFHHKKIKGWREGLYLRTLNRITLDSTTFHQKSQKEAIKSMEERIKKLEGKDANEKK